MGKIKELEQLIRENILVSPETMIDKICEHFNISKQDVSIELINNAYDFKIKLPESIDSLNLVVSWEIVDEKNL